MRVGLELLRIVLTFVLVGAAVWLLLGPLYTIHETAERYQWLGASGVYLLLFVMYRNRWRFSGWYQGEGRTRLPMLITKLLVSLGIILILLPWMLASLIG
ncbi:hypothetical protein SAMN04487936_101490 [Halobacillus dabanensis]|uniref:Uncharacterized protein n=1 Tax=Halobacillus dabanensis TaxID=240302 RepID=A0A1I3Q0A3_HALDA|nr:hypothetical protein [Halobacillus dabanensis]SFJ26891.1 hypothetical protein SAMN04487936_101490 [Halobacillus dabanensis]